MTITTKGIDRDKEKEKERVKRTELTITTKGRDRDKENERVKHVQGTGSPNLYIIILEAGRWPICFQVIMFNVYFLMRLGQLLLTTRLTE